MTFNWGICSHRSTAVEKIETSDVSDHDLGRVFDFLEFAGRLGGRRIVLDTLADYASRWGAGSPITLLDIRCGRGDLSRSIVGWARRRKVEVQILAVDRYGRLVHMARQRSAGYPEITFDVRDISDPLFLQAQQFDYVISDLTLHRQDMDQSVAFLKKANLLAKRGLIIGDFLRDVRGWLGVTSLARLWRNETVRHDAALFIQRGYTRHELAQMAKKAGLDYVRIRDYMGVRFSLSGERGLVMSAEMSPLTA